MTQPEAVEPEDLSAAPEAAAEPSEEAAANPAASEEAPAPTAEPPVEGASALGAAPEAASVSGASQQLVLTAKPVEARAAEKPARSRKQQEKEEADIFPFSVMVGKVYDGPLDLLLDLIRKQDIDIYDIPIARITAQFLAYVNRLKSSDVDVAGEFIYTASLLIHIKSKMLLPRTPTSADEAAEDPRRELVERLLEHERFKNAAQMLQQKQMLEANTWSNPGFREFKNAEGTEAEVAADTTDLVRVFRDILDRASKRPSFNIKDDSVSVGQMIRFLAQSLRMTDRPVALHKLLRNTRSERALVATFLALLELVRLQAVLLRQDSAFSEIFVKKNTAFDDVVNEGLQARDDWRE
jgi:segregation and condensation protein A